MPAPLQPGDRVRAGDRVYHSDAPKFHGQVTRVQIYTTGFVGAGLDVDATPITVGKATVRWDNGETSIHPIDKLHRIEKETA